MNNDKNTVQDAALEAEQNAFNEAVKDDTSDGKIIQAYEGKLPYLFVSYRHLNSDIVLQVIEKLRLRDKPYRLWYDEGIAPGSEWPRNVSDHLNRSSTVVCFISKDFLKSVNCENEVKNAVAQNKNIIVYSLDGTVHPSLAGYPSVLSADELIAALPGDLIGSEDDYALSGMKVSNGNAWNALLPVMLTLVAAFGVGMFGMFNGWFDTILKDHITRADISYEDVAYDDEADMGEISEVEITSFAPDPLLESMFTETGKPVPWYEIEFESEDSRRMLYDALGIDDMDFRIKYEDIETNTEVTELRFTDINDEVAGLISSYPYLRKLYISGGSLTTLKPLTDSPNLRRVYISKKLLEDNDIYIPKYITTDKINGRSFKVYILDQ